MTYLTDFKKKIDITHYEKKEIYYSEMFYFYRECKGITRIIESGTYLGNSTAILAKLFPDVEIITYEKRKARYNEARKNLEEFANVRCIHGKLGHKDYKWKSSDAVLIDGPKHKDAIRLAVKIHKYGPPAFIAMHDMWPWIDYLKKRFKAVGHSGNGEAKELDKHIPYNKLHHNNDFYGAVLAVVK